ncbi:MAG: hypothetical protein GY895_05485 [Phycisphaera sp.]|nr:hypothetical protein [Phycisphaera sp.]
MMLFDIRTSGRFIAPLMLAGGLLGCQPGQPTESDPAWRADRTRRERSPRLPG